MLFVSVIVPELFSILAPPPSIAPLFVNLFLVNDIAPELELISAPRPEPLSTELSSKILFVKIIAPELVSISAPTPEPSRGIKLPLNILLVSVILPVPEVRLTPPPPASPPALKAVFEVNVLDVNVMLDLEVEIKAPPPLILAELISNLQFSIATRAEEVRMKRPAPSLSAKPCCIFKLLIVITTLESVNG